MLLSCLMYTYRIPSDNGFGCMDLEPCLSLSQTPVLATVSWIRWHVAMEESPAVRRLEWA